MRAAIAALLGASLALAWIAIDVGVPRLYGTGCTHTPFGFAVAIEESDFLGPCTAIRPIWSN